MNYRPVHLTTAPATTIAYVIKGFFAYMQTFNLIPATCLKYCTGEHEIVQEIIRLASNVDEEHIDLQCAEQDFPGVWDYEISEPFGAQLANYVHLYGKLPDMSLAKGMVIALVTQATKVPEPAPTQVEVLAEMLDEVKEVLSKMTVKMGPRMSVDDIMANIDTLHKAKRLLKEVRGEK